jgi:internalin A
LVDTGLTSLPSEIGELSNLDTLDVSYNNLAELPSQINRLPLTTLNLANNQLTSLPAEIGQRANLIFVTRLTSTSDLAELPLEMDLSNPSIINLSGNPLSGLPPEIRCLADSTWNLFYRFRHVLPSKLSRFYYGDRVCFSD